MSGYILRVDIEDCVGVCILQNECVLGALCMCARNFVPRPPSPSGGGSGNETGVQYAGTCYLAHNVGPLTYMLCKKHIPYSMQNLIQLRACWTLAQYSCALAVRLL